MRGTVWVGVALIGVMPWAEVQGANCDQIVFYSQSGRQEAHRDAEPDQFVRIIADALRELCTGNSSDSAGARIARATYARISSGDVSIEPLANLTELDYLRVRREFLQKDPAAYTFPESYTGFRANSPEAVYIMGAYAGWMWETRIYVNLSKAHQTKPLELAATLVHETNHVLNRSEENYYILDGGGRCHIHDANAILRTDLPQQLREEYRAYLVEYYFSDTFALQINRDAGFADDIRRRPPAVRNVLATYVRGQYDLPESVPLQDNNSEDSLYPTAARWEKQRRTTARESALYPCR